MGALHLIGKAYFASGALLFGTRRGRGGIYSPGALFGVEEQHNLRHGRTVPQERLILLQGCCWNGTMCVEGAAFILQGRSLVSRGGIS